ncbi:MAG: hypothetical protein L6R48_17445 [Planctomycetes bacterium]|nr:hypothetical protein [Planctomycetota bacterium]
MRLIPTLLALVPALLAAADWPVALAGGANMGLADEVAGDGRGGWSDQGAGNDFRNFDRTRNRYGGAPFSVLDPAANGGTAVITLGSRRFPAGPAAVTVTLPEPRSAPYLYLLHTSCWNGLPAGTTVGTIEVEAVDGTRRAIAVRNGSDVADWWEPKGLANGTLGALVTNGESSVGAYVSRFDTGLTAAVRSLTFRGEPSAEPIWIVVAATLSDTKHAAEPADLARRWTAAANERWRPIDLRQVRVKPGSALDFSRLVPAGELRRLSIDAEGSFSDQGRPVRLWGASIDMALFANGFALGRDLSKATWPGDEAIAGYAEQIRVQGYNLVRLGAYQNLLMRWAAKDGEFDPRAVAVIDRFIAELRRRGIRIYLDLGTFFAGNPWTAEAQAKDPKRRLFTDPAFRANWLAGSQAVLNHRNPHTGLTLAEDPAVVSVLPFNEQDIPFADLNRLGTLPAAEWAPAWRAWLERTYGDPAAVAKAWGVAVQPFAEIPLPDAAALRTGGARAADLGRFMLERHRELLAWYAQGVAATGCQAPISQYDAIPSLFFHALRGEAAVGAIEMHAYHAHPSEWARPGSKTAQSSACASLAPYLRLLASCRQFGKPYLVTEYGQVFWNRHRHEEGLMAGSFAAFQGWDAMMAHQLPVGDLAAPAYAWADGSIDRTVLREHELDKAPIKPFWVAPDPVARASQVLSTLAYADGAVARSPHRVEVVVDPARLFQGDAFTGGMPGVQRDLALVARLGVRVGALRGAAAAAGTIEIPLAGTAKVSATDAAAGMAEGSGDPVRLLALLRSRGVLEADNPSDPLHGLWQSPDGSMRWERENQWFQLLTARLAGGCFTRRTSGEVGPLRVERVTVPGTVAAAALDGRALGDSRRVLLVYATDALNSGMVFAAEDRTTLVDPGKAPVLVEAGALTARLANANAATLHAWALGFDGARRQELPLVREDGAVRLAYDMAALPEPAFFVELAVE